MADDLMTRISAFATSRRGPTVVQRLSIDPEKIDTFSRLMADKFDNGDVNARQAYVRADVDAFEVYEKAILIIDSKDILQAVLAGKQTTNENVRGFVLNGGNLARHSE